DKLPESQRTSGFAMQSLMIGLGGSCASALPWMLSHWFHVSSASTDGIPHTVEYAFYIGGTMFMLAILYTVFTSKEYPPADLGFKEKVKETHKGFGGGAKEIIHSIIHMPTRMRQLALVQFFTWPGLFLMWFYYSTAVARNIFGAADEKSIDYTHGV